MDLKNLNTHLQQFKAPNMKVPVLFHTSEKLLPDKETFSQLETLGKDDRLFSHIAAMSDVHPKKGRKNPTGTVIASKDYLFPQINDTAPNCGMRFIKTDFNSENLPEDQIDKLFQKLIEVIPTKKYIGTTIPYSLSLDIAKKGLKPLLEYFGTETKNELENTFYNGNMLGREATTREILNVIPKLFFHVGKYRLGILGAAGNHFLDLMKITEIKDEKVAKKFNIKKGQYIFLMHTGSGLLGQYASYMYTPKIKEHFSQKMMLKIGTALFDSQKKKIYRNIAEEIRKYQNKDDFFAYEADSLEGQMFITAHQAAANFGFANRSLLTFNLDQAIEEVLGKKGNLDLLYDSSHIMVTKEKHFGEDVWIHRNGTVRANGPERMQNHPLFSQTGEPVFIPSSMSTPAYLGVGTDENDSSFFSASHGTGRKKEADAAPASKEELMKRMESKKVKLYNAKSKGVILQDSSFYKDVEEVISGMEENKTINAVAKMEPVAVLMY